MKNRLKYLLKKLVLRRLIIFLLCFFLADSVLRRIVYAPTKQSKGNESMMEVLPDFLKEYFSKLEQIDKLETKLADTKDTAERREIFFEIAELSSERKKRHILREVIAEDPYSFEVYKAWQGLLMDLDDEELITDYLDFALYCDVHNPNQKSQVWSSGWYVLEKSTDREAQVKYLIHMADYRVVDSGLSSAYMRLWRYALDHDLNTYQEIAEELEGRCKELYKQEIKKAQQQK